MAGTVTTTEAANKQFPINEVKFAWTSSAGGAADATTTDSYNGEVVEVLIIPGGTTPSDLFDVTVTDANSVDVLLGQGANCSNANTTRVTGCTSVVASKLTLGVTNAGNAKTGTVIIHIAERG